MIVAINGINIRGEKKKILNSLISLLKQKKFIVYISEELAKTFNTSKMKVYTEHNISKIDFIISFGGDGTLLNTVTSVGSKKIKILGVNVGKLGFLFRRSAKGVFPDVLCWMSNTSSAI